jgi:uncharacterized membrane protein YhaH (DUF805 family)
MVFTRRHNGSSPVDDVPTVVVDKPIPDTPVPDVWAEHAQRRRERVQTAEQKFSEMIDTRHYDPDDKDAFDGQIDAEAADWLTQDVETHRKYRSEISERLAEAKNDVTRTEKELTAAEQELRDTDQKVLDAPLQLGGRPTPVPTTDAAAVVDPASTQAGAQSIRRWRDPVAMHRLHNPRWIRLLLVAAFVGDSAAFYIVLERLFRSYQAIVVPVMFAVAAIALVLCYAVGRSLRRRRDAHDTDHSDIWLWLPLVAWILLGIATACVRLFFGNLSAPALVFGAPEASTASGDHLAILPAVLFLTLYFASGIGAMYAFHEDYNPAAMDYQLAVSRRDKAKREAARCARMCSAAQARKARIEEEGVHADRRLERAELVTHNEVVGLKHFVRHRMAGNTDNPRGLALFMEDAPQPVELPDEDDL